jgi:hypothetical protein
MRFSHSLRHSIHSFHEESSRAAAGEKEITTAVAATTTTAAGVEGKWRSNTHNGE